jgi:hypothetical protein
MLLFLTEKIKEAFAETKNYSPNLIIIIKSDFP